MLRSLPFQRSCPLFQRAAGSTLQEKEDCASPPRSSLPSLAPARANWEGHGFFHATMSCVAVLFVIVSVAGMVVTKLTLPLGQIAPRVLLLALLLGGAAFYRWRRLPRAVNLIALTFWAVLFGFLHLVPMFVAARMRVEPCDALLARLDARLGLEVPDVLNIMDAFPRVQHLLGICYDTLIFLVTLAIMIPPMCGKMRVAKE